MISWLEIWVSNGNVHLFVRVSKSFKSVPLYSYGHAEVTSLVSNRATVCPKNVGHFYFYNNFNFGKRKPIVD